MLCGSWWMYLVEREDLLLPRRRRGRSDSGAGADGRRSGRRSVDSDAGRGYGINGSSLESGGYGGGVLVGRGTNTEGCWNGQ